MGPRVNPCGTPVKMKHNYQWKHLGDMTQTIYRKSSSGDTHTPM